MSKGDEDTKKESDLGSLEKCVNEGLDRARGIETRAERIWDSITGGESPKEEEKKPEDRPIENRIDGVSRVLESIRISNANTIEWLEKIQAIVG